MTESQHLLLLLLKRSLDRQHAPAECCPLLLAEDTQTIPWNQIIAQACNQEVSGLAFEALQTLPNEQHPDTEILMHWTAQVCADERDFKLYTERCCNIMQTMQQNGLTFILMKGLSLASLYPNPSHRPIGDLDLFLCQEQMPQAKAFLQQQGAHIDPQLDLKHVSATHMGINLELHFKSIWFYSKRSERQYRKIETEDTSSTELCTLSLERLFQPTEHQTLQSKDSDHNNTILQPFVFPPLLEILYLTAHIQHHLLLEEIKLRHVVDWMVALHHNRTALAISEVQLMRQLNLLGLTRLFRALGYIAINYLGLSQDSYAGCTKYSKKEAKRGEYLLSIILKQHIPGCNVYEPRTPNDSFFKKARLYRELILRCYHLRTLIPRECWAAPLGFIKNAIKRRLG